MLTITTNSFENDVLHADKPVLVDFWAQWCPDPLGSIKTSKSLS